MKTKFLLFSVALIFPFLQLNLFSSEALTTAKKLFHENKLREASTQIKSILENPGEGKIEALLLKFYIHEINKDYINGVKTFREIIKSVDNPKLYIWGLYASNSVQKCPYYADEGLINLFTELLEKNTLDANTTALLNDFLFKRLDVKWKTSKAEIFAKNLHPVLDWQALGVFENISGSGFDKYFAPLSFPDSSHIFSGKNDSQLKWFNLLTPKFASKISLHDYFTYQNSSIYLQTFCISNVNQEVYLRLGVSGTVKLWINDVEVLSEPQERNTCIDAYSVKVNLNSGANRILLQLGVGEEISPAFTLRVTDQLGVPIQGLFYSKNYVNYNKGTSTNNSKVDLSFQNEFLELISKKGNSEVFKLLLSKYYKALDLNLENIRLLKSIESDYKNSGYVLNELVEAYELSESFEASKIAKMILVANAKQHPMAIHYAIETAYEKKEMNEVSSLIQLLSENCSSEEMLLSEKIIFALKNRSYSKLDELISTASKKYPDNPESENIIFTLQNRSYSKLDELITTAYKKFPDNPEFVLAKYSLGTSFSFSENMTIRWYGRFNDNDKCIAEYLNDYKDLDFTKKLGGIYYTLGRNDKIISLFKDITDEFPENVTFLAAIGINYFIDGKLDKAEKYLLDCIKYAPYQSEFRYLLGLNYKLKGDDANSLICFKKSLDLDPYNVKVLEEINRLEHKENVFKYFPTPNLQSIYQASLEDKDPENENCYVLYDRTDKIVLTGGMYEQRNYLLIKALTQDGRDILKDKILPEYEEKSQEIESAIIFKKNGQRINATVKDRRVIYTNLEIGDAVGIIIKYKSLAPGILAKYYDDKKIFASQFPSKSIIFRLLAPPEESFTYKMSNSFAKADVKELEGYKLYTWEKTNVPAFKPEPFAANLCDYAPTLNVTTIPSWAYIVQWYSDIIAAKLKPNYELNEVVKEIKAKNLNTDLEKAFAAYEYVVKNIKYSYAPFRQNGIIPQRTSNVIVSKVGDCKDVSTLFVSICRELGLKANTALVCTRDNGFNSMPLPSVDFNHVIGCVELNDKKVFVELTSDKVPFGSVSGMLKGAWVLEIGDSSNAELISIDSDNFILNSKYRFTTVDFESNDMNVKVKSIKTGGCAGDMRASFINLNEEDKRKYISGSLGSSFKNFKLGKFQFTSDLNSLKDSLFYDYDFKITNACSNIGGLKIFTIPVIDAIQGAEVFAMESRKTTMDLTSLFDNDLVEEQITINIPKGRVLSEIPENKKIETKFGVYELTFNQNENQLNVFRRFYLKCKDVRQQEYQELKLFMNEVMKNDETQIGFK